MLDVPAHIIDEPKTEIGCIVDKPSYIQSSSHPLLRNVADPLYLHAELMVSAMKDGFQWCNMATLIHESFLFVQENKALSFEQQKHQVVVLMSYIIDLTDTPYLPDNFTDPLFKAILPALINIIGDTLNNHLHITSSRRLAPPSAETFTEFATELYQNFAGKWKWSDLGHCLYSSINFVCGFSSLSLIEKKSNVIEMINLIIDAVDIPYLPDNLIDPVLKTMVPSFVDFMFEKMT